LQRLVDEQKLSQLIRGEDYLEAALMAFRMNKLRDFYLVMNKIVSASQAKPDPVDSVLLDRQRFKQFTNKAAEMSGIKYLVQAPPKNEEMITKVVTELMKQEGDKKKLIEIMRNLNSKHEYAQIA